MSNFGFPLNDFKDQPDKCTDLLANYLKNGQLGLLLGAGVSKALDLPNWNELIFQCIAMKGIDKPNGVIDNTILKQLADQFKDQCTSTEEYLDIIKNALYNNVKFDFSLARKELLIALTSLIVGKTRGNVHDIITYNFDDVLEWYLRTNGLSVNTISPDQLFNKVADVNVVHLHGYLPHSNDSGVNSTFLIYSKEEFEDRSHQDSYWNDLLLEFLRRHIFLSVGVSAQSLIDDLAPLLRVLETWYDREKIKRDQPYGFAYVTPDITDDQRNRLVKNGIIPCTLEIPDFPPRIFQIAQKALSKNRYQLALLRWESVSFFSTPQYLDCSENWVGCRINNYFN